MRRALGQITFSRLMRLSRELPAAREFFLSRADYLQVAVKEPTLPVKPLKPPDAGPDWKPPPPEPPPAFIRFDGAGGTVEIRPRDSLHLGEVETR